MCFDVGTDTGMGPLKTTLASRYYQMSADMPASWEVFSFRIPENKFTVANYGAASGTIRVFYIPPPRPTSSYQIESSLHSLQNFLLLLVTHRQTDLGVCSSMEKAKQRSAWHTGQIPRKYKPVISFSSSW